MPILIPIPIPIYYSIPISILHNFRHMPNHQSNNNDSKNLLTHDNINNTHTYNKHTLLTLRKAHTNQTQTQIIQTTTLSNNRINNYNIEHKHNKNNTLNNTCKHTKPHFRSKFKQITQIHHINHNTHTKALRSDPPVALAAADCHRGGSWGCPVQQHAGPQKLRSLPAAAGWTAGDTLTMQTQSKD